MKNYKKMLCVEEKAVEKPAPNPNEVDIEVPPTEKRVGRVKLECPHISEDESQTIC